MLVRNLGIALGLLAANGLAQPARACSPPLPGFSAVRPEAGAQIPANAVLFVQGNQIFPFEANWLDFDVFLPLPVSQQDGFGRVDLEFAATSGIGEIEITLHHVGEFDIEPMRLGLRADSVEHDTVGPVLGGPPIIEWEQREYAPGLCEPGGFAVTVRVPAARDDWGVAAYLLVVSDSTRPNTERVVARRLAPRDPASNIVMVHHAGEEPGRRCYSIIAYDIAGNTQTSTEPAVCVDVGSPQMDAGTVDASPRIDAGSLPDAGMASDVGPGTNRPGALATGSRGCTCSGPSQNESLAMALGLLFVVSLRRRGSRA